MTPASNTSSKNWSTLTSFLGFNRAVSERQADLGYHRTAVKKNEITQIADFLTDADLDASPSNYALAWEYYYGTNFQLRCAIETMLDRVGCLTSDQADELMTTHNSPMSAKGIQKMVAESTTLISNGEKTLTKSRDDSAEYGAALQESLGSLTSKDHDWAAQFEGLLQITNAMVDRTKKAEQKLKSASARLNFMHEELQKAKESAGIDLLTGLPNRRAFERHFAAAVERSNKHTSNLSIAFIDIDFFKSVNDTHGHETGDRVLVEIAKQLNKMSSGKCHVARHGGEEFVVLFEGKNATEAKDLVDGCRIQMAERYLTNRETQQPIGTVTFSAGISSLNGKTGPRELLRNADTALYHAKHHGRNQSVVFDDIAIEES